MSKAALNMATRNVAHELKPSLVICAALHPGTVDTSFSRRYHANAVHAVMPVDVAVARLAAVVSALRPDDSGAFLSYEGVALPF